MAIADGLSPFSIPKYISAQSPEGLRRLMRLNNNKHGVFFRYFDIQFAKGKWYAWYYIDTKKELEDEAMGVKE